MKIKSILISMMAMAAVVGCVKSAPEAPEQVIEGQSYLSLSISSQSNPLGRQQIDPGITPNEDKVSTVHVLCFDKNLRVLEVVDYSGVATQTNKVVAATSKPVPSATDKVLVILNNSAKWDLTNFKGKQWSEVNEIIEVDAADLAETYKFVMVNSGVNVDPATYTHEDLGGLVPVYDYINNKSYLGKDEAEANSKKLPVYVDRLAVKVEFAVNSAVVVMPTGSLFELDAWALNTTNKKTALYTLKFEHANASVITGGTKAVYRKDHNYTGLGVITTEAELNANYNNLTNVATNAAAWDTYNADNFQLPGSATTYCPENTMDAADQIKGHTTKVTLKTYYIPASIKGEFPAWDANKVGTSYFIHNFNGTSTAYTVAQLKALDLDDVANAELKTDIIAFFKHAGITVTDDASIDAAIDAKLDSYIGVKVGVESAKTLPAPFGDLLYFHNSVNYYDALIRHDNSSTIGIMELGRWGVVRNNWYDITLNRVNGNGTPWIPINPPTDNDDNVSNLALTITINPWTLWNHGVEI